MDSAGGKMAANKRSHDSASRLCLIVQTAGTSGFLRIGVSTLAGFLTHVKTQPVQTIMTYRSKRLLLIELHVYQPI